MKKYLILALLSTCGLSVFAQAEFDALKMSQSDIIGTARFVSMSGAFGALGGDMSAINLNPAGIGVYRSSEFSLTPSYQMDKSKSNYDGKTDQTSKANVLLNGIGYVGSFRTYDESAISNFNFGITYNRIADFNQNTKMGGLNRKISLLDRVCYVENGLWYNDGTHPDHTDFYRFMNGVHVIGLNTAGNAYLPNLNVDELMNSNMEIQESGGIDSWNFTLGANYNHSLYIGIGLGIQTIDYEKTTKYNEDYGQKGIELRNALTTTGTGVDFKAGLIYRPVPELRLGLSYRSGTYYSLTNVFNASMASFDFYNPDTKATYSPDPKVIGTETYVDYMLKMPWQITLSAAYQFENKGMLSIDIDCIDNRNLSMKNDEGYDIQKVNDYIESDFQKSYNIRLGGEIRLTDNFSARLGAAYYMTPIVAHLENLDIATADTRTDYSMTRSTIYTSMGAGYHSGAFFLDLALQNRRSNEHFFDFCETISDTTVPTYSTMTRDKLNLIATAGFKF